MHRVARNEDKQKESFKRQIPSSFSYCYLICQCQQGQKKVHSQQVVAKTNDRQNLVILTHDLAAHPMDGCWLY